MSYWIKEGPMQGGPYWTGNRTLIWRYDVYRGYKRGYCTHTHLQFHEQCNSTIHSGGQRTELLQYTLYMKIHYTHRSNGAMTYPSPVTDTSFVGSMSNGDALEITVCRLPVFAVVVVTQVVVHTLLLNQH